VKSTAAVTVAAERFRAAGLTVRTEDQVDCCYAVQDKVWVEDPDGNQWEVFVVTADSPHRVPAAAAAATNEGACCASTCCQD
jgi:hypothetical protein